MAIDITSIGIGVDTAKLKTGARDLDSFGQSANKAATGADKSSTAMDGMMASAKRLIGGIGVATMGRALIGTIDNYTKLSAQLNIASRNQDDYNKSFSDVIRISTAAQTSLNSTATLYARLANTLKDTNVTQQQFAQITETVALGLRVSRAAQTESRSAMLQLSQAFASGVLRGEEFNAVSEASFPLMRALADSMGIPIEQLRSMAHEGRITRNELVKAFTDPELIESFREQAKQMETISGAWQVFKNSLTLIIGEMNKTSEASGFVVSAIKMLTSGVAFLADVFVGAVAGIKQFGRSLAVVFNDIVTSAKIAALSINPLIAFLNKDTIQKTIDDRNRFLEAANEDMDKFLKGNYTKFRDLLNETRSTAEKPYDTSSLQNYGKAVSATSEEIKKSQKVMLDYYDRTNNQIADEITERRKEDEADRVEFIRYYADLQMDALRERQAAEKKLVDDQIRANKNASEEYLRDVKKAEEERRREHQRTADELTRSITDALLRGFESGKDFAQNFRDTLINMFQTLILRPTIEAIVKPVSGALSGVMSGEGGGLSSLFGGGNGSLIGTIREGFSSLNNNVVGSISDLGTFLSSGNGGLGDAIGGFLGKNASTIASALAFAPAAMSLLSGDFKSAAFEGAGAAIGTALGGPVGGAIGSFLGGAVGGLFGGSGEQYKQVIQQRGGNFAGGNFRASQGQAVRSNAGLVTGLDALNQRFSQNLSALLEGFDLNDRVGTNSSVRLRRTSGRTAGRFSARFAGGGIDLGGRDWQFGGDGDIGAGFQQFAARVLGEGLSKAIQSSAIPKGIKKFFDGLSNNKAIVETINAVVGLNKALSELPPVFDAIDFALFTTKFNVGIKQLQEDFAATQKYTELFYSEQENFDTFTRQLQAQFADLNVVMPTTREAFRALIDGFEVTSEATYNQLQALIRLAPASDAYYKSIEAQRSALVNLSAEMFRTQFEFNRAQIYERTGIPLSMLPSYDVGTPFVPKTGPAMIHQGERILTASENRDFGNVGMEIRGLGGELRNMRAELQSIAVTSARLQKSVDRLEKDGFIIRDVDAEGNAQVLQVEVIS